MAKDIRETNEEVESTPTKKKWLPVIIAGAVVVFMIISGGVNERKQRLAEEEARLAAEEEARLQEETESQLNLTPGSDEYLISKQDSFRERFGTPPDGYMWDYDGTLLSLGDKNMSAEEVVYAYFNGLAALDFSTVQKYSRNSKVYSTFNGYFDKSSNNDYSDSFMRNMYRVSLLSIQPKSVSSSVVFAENKQVFTVKASMLDLTHKEFWFKDKYEIYKNLKIFRKDQSDSTKADIYLYDYISSYYASPDAVRRDVTFDITLERYTDLDTGWLVSIDSDVDLACKYANGTLVVNYIKQMYSEEGNDYLDNYSSGK